MNLPVYLYCFDSEKCYTIEEVYEKNIIPLDEATEIINNSSITAYAYSKKDDIKTTVQRLYSLYFGAKDATCEILGEYDKYTFFTTGKTSHSDYKIIDDYYIDYAAGLYIFDGENIYSLIYALQEEKIKIADAAEIIDAKPLGDATLDGRLDMNDVVWMQRLLASLEHLENSTYRKTICDINKDGKQNMEDVVRMQQKIAEL